MKAVCSVDDCDRTVVARGWCSLHYARWVNAGKPADWLDDDDDTGYQRPPVTDHDILAVARAHGTTIAAEWANRTQHYVRELRKRIDGYDRGRGHPNADEIAARAPRLSCDCWYCIDWRSDEAIRSNIRVAATRGGVTEPDRGWRAHAACAGTDPDVFFPEHVGPASLELYDEARAICATCTVTERCLQFALDNHLDHGIYGGLNPVQRARVARDRQRQTA